MSEKTAKRHRRILKKFNMEVFKDLVVEISSMRFRTRLWFCLKMAFCRHELQKKMKPEIEARRKLTVDGEVKKDGS